MSMKKTLTKNIIYSINEIIINTHKTYFLLSSTTGLRKKLYYGLIIIIAAQNRDIHSINFARVAGTIINQAACSCCLNVFLKVQQLPSH